jgi:hypothetical protein
MEVHLTIRRKGGYMLHLDTTNTITDLYKVENGYLVEVQTNFEGEVGEHKSFYFKSKAEAMRYRNRYAILREA